MSLRVLIRRKPVHSEIRLCEALDNYIRLDKFALSVASKSCDNNISVYTTEYIVF